MSGTDEIRVGVIGLGFMGRTHVNAYRAAAEAGYANRLVAVCDSSPERLTGEASEGGNALADTAEERLFDPAEVRGYTEADAMFADDSIDLVSICAPTDSHVELAVAALRAGKHVLVEKPVALTSASVQELVTAAAASDRLCMPAMCIRFWPGWRWLKETIETGEFGPVLSAVFRRLAAPPSWSPSFYRDSARTGGALFDLHIHDADFVRWLFGDPSSVVSTGSLDHLTTLYDYPDGPRHVVAEGGWDHSAGFPFHMGYTVVFEHATAAFDLARPDPLYLARDGEISRVEVPDGTGYDGQIRHLLGALHSGAEKLDATPEDALGHTRLLEAEKQSLETNVAAAL